MSSPTAASRPVPGSLVGGGTLPPRRTGLVEVSLDGETVVYDPAADLLHHLDRGASVVWSRLAGEVTIGALAEAIAVSYGAPETTVRRDIVDLANTLAERGLLRGTAGPAMATSDRPVRPDVGPEPVDATLADLGLDERSLPDAPHRTGRCRALEHLFEVVTNDAAVRDYLDEILVDLAWSGSGRPEQYRLLQVGDADRGGRYVVLHNGEPVTVTDWLDRAIAVLLWKINAEVVRQAARRYPIVHAAAAVSHGVAVLLPGPPESGKTTTVAALVSAGFAYLTDEAVAIDAATLLAQPYPKALSVDRGSWQVLADLRPPHGDRVAGQWHIPARLIRRDAVADPAPLRFVVTPAYRPGSATALQPISRADMLMRMADSTFHFQDDAAHNLAVLARVVTGADCYQLSIGELHQAVGLIAELVGSEELDVTEGEPPLAQRRHRALREGSPGEHRPLARKGEKTAGS